MRHGSRFVIAAAVGIALTGVTGVSAAAFTLPDPGQSASATVVSTPSAIPTSPSIPSPTHSPSPTSSATPSYSPSPTNSPTPSATPTATPTATPSEPKKPTEQEIKDIFKGWNDALKTLDPAKVADRYAPDAVLLPTKSDKVRTDRDGIIDYFKTFLTGKPTAVIVESHIKILSDTAAIDTGVYEFTMADNSKVKARYTFVYELRDGKWLIVNHHSSAMPEKK